MGCSPPQKVLLIYLRSAQVYEENVMTLERIPTQNWNFSHDYLQLLSCNFLNSRFKGI